VSASSYATFAASKAFYSKLLPEDHPCVSCGQGKSTTYSVNEYQFVELSRIIRPYTTTSPEGNVVDEIIFATDDLAALRRYLTARNVQLSSPPPPDMEPQTPATKGRKKATPTKTKEPPPETFMSTRDPEGHRIGFIQLPAEAFGGPFDPRGKRLIHAGFVVRDPAAEDRFYKDILGFRLYWHGGMKDGDDEWVDMQVPDGTDWIEYMLGASPSPSHETLGAMNHFAIGINDIEAAAYAAKKSGLSATEDPQVGRDGKWQLNLYDPDETRVEMMEFKPTKEPCCSPYTGPHPGPPQ
jgi:catechol 2,3-dioxygenase-like lactoylglutathione lyase family enzyme